MYAPRLDDKKRNTKEGNQAFAEIDGENRKAVIK